ncbi:MAG: helix-turn-helix transcriptional regulator [Cyanobacteria bacterium SZAS LIN-3]|nr:helix-turn-helix transcriptional regulator [Cyanobacteria bacterium SZAS LIN-3]
MRRSQLHSDTLLSHLGDALRNRRVDIGITQQELANRTELHRTYITDVETGKRNISIRTYNKLTEALLCAMSFPLREMERTMSREGAGPLFGDKGGLSKGSILLRLKDDFFQKLENVALELQVKASMSKVQVDVENYSRDRGNYPYTIAALRLALHPPMPINPFTKNNEEPSIGSAVSEDIATRVPSKLRPGEIEYSPLNQGENYIIRGGGADGNGLEGHTIGSVYVLSGNLRTDNQP